MTRILTLTGIRRSALSWVWIEGGNPRQPLARIWVDREMRIAQHEAGTQEQTQPCCA